jgi:hypothetical protein
MVVLSKIRVNKKSVGAILRSLQIACQEKSLASRRGYKLPYSWFHSAMLPGVKSSFDFRKTDFSFLIVANGV